LLLCGHVEGASSSGDRADRSQRRREINRGPDACGQARLAAARLRDTDALVEQAGGRRIAAIFAEDGEACFRDLEAQALQTALADAPCVVATGGGVVLLPENRALLRAAAFVVWLDAPTEALVARLQAHDEERPLLAGDAHARLEMLRAARAGLYAETATLTVVTAGRTADAICDDVLWALKTPQMNTDRM
jgi:shikimate kinase